MVKWVYLNGEDLPAYEFEDAYWEFQGSEVIFRWSKDDKGERYRYILDLSKLPHWIDFRHSHRPTILGIYKLDGDELTVCHDEGSSQGETLPRPTELSVKNGEENHLFVLKRVRK